MAKLDFSCPICGSRFSTTNTSPKCSKCKAVLKVKITSKAERRKKPWLCIKRILIRRRKDRTS